MAKTHSQSVIEYNRKRDNLMCRPTKREGELIRAAAKAAGMSVQAYMLEAVREHTERKAPTPPRWIPVEERLPELGTLVVALSVENEVVFAFRLPVTGEWAFPEKDRPIVPQYWMPLPERPGMEGQKEES